MATAASPSKLPHFSQYAMWTRWFHVSLNSAWRTGSKSSSAGLYSKTAMRITARIRPASPKWTPRIGLSVQPTLIGQRHILVRPSANVNAMRHAMQRYFAPETSTSTTHTVVRDVMNSVFISLPPNARFAGVSGVLILPSSLPSGLKT